MKIGIIAYSTETGLGRQSFEIYKQLKPEKILLVDLSEYNMMPTNHNKFEGNVRISNGIPNNSEMKWLTEDIDVIFICETPLNYNLYTYAKDKNIKVIQQYNYEFLDYIKKPYLPKPSILASPTTWNFNRIKALKYTETEILRIPVKDNKIIPRKINSVKTIGHIIGRPTVLDRNGTEDFLNVIKKLGDKYNYQIFYQEPKDYRAKDYFDHIRRKINLIKNKYHIQIIKDIEQYKQMYSKMDLHILPRRYGGLCLPMNETLSAGIPIIMPKISPNADLLPEEWLNKSNFKTSFNFHAYVDVYESNIDSIVERVDYIDKNIQEANTKAIEIANSNTWDTYIKKYFKLLME